MIFLLLDLCPEEVLESLGHIFSVLLMNRETGGLEFRVVLDYAEEVCLLL